MPGLYSHTTRATGTVLTANIYNSDHQNHIDNQTPQMTDDYSSSAGQMQSAVDPGESGSESLPTSLSGELERLRFALKEIKNYLAIEAASPQWYSTPTNKVASNKLATVQIADGGTGSTTLAAAQSALAIVPAVDTISGNVTLTNADVQKVKVVTASATITLPDAATLAIGDSIRFKSTTTGDVQLDPAGTDTLDGLTTNYRLPSYTECRVMKSAAGAYILIEKPNVDVGDWKWAGYGTAPNGWLKAGSGNQSRTTFASLFAVYGTTWGVGDGSTTFGLPDARGKVPVQAGTGTSTDGGGNTEVDTTADTLTVPSNNTKWITGMPVVFTLTSGTITGLTSGNTYYIIRNSATLVKLASSLANAQKGTAIDMTAKSSPVWTITYTQTARTLGEYGGEEAHAQAVGEESPHTHTVNAARLVAATFGIVTSGTATSDGGSATAAANAGGAAANITQPFLTGELYIKT